MDAKLSQKLSLIKFVAKTSLIGLLFYIVFYIFFRFILGINWEDIMKFKWVSTGVRAVTCDYYGFKIDIGGKDIGFHLAFPIKAECSNI